MENNCYFKLYKLKISIYTSKFTTFIVSRWINTIKNRAISLDDGLSLLCEAFNAHHSFWYSPEANARGKHISNAYSTFNFIILNDNPHPQQQSQAYFTSLGLIFALLQLHSLLINWYMIVLYEQCSFPCTHRVQNLYQWSISSHLPICRST